MASGLDMFNLSSVWAVEVEMLVSHLEAVACSLSRTSGRDADLAVCNRNVDLAVSELTQRGQQEHRFKKRSHWREVEEKVSVMT